MDQHAWPGIGHVGAGETHGKLRAIGVAMA
jgi:uncharacterized protein (DUF362 family)